MIISQKGIDEIVKREALRLKSYKCIAGKWTIGIGHTFGVTEGMMISKETAYRLFREDIAPVQIHLNQLNDQCIRKFKQCEFDALVSFIHQIGLPSFRSSTCRRYILMERPPEQIAREFQKWSYITDPVTKQKVWSDSVCNRHKGEEQQYLGKIYDE
jgi:lysozyme